MNKTLDILNRAKSLREKNQQNIDVKLKEDIETALKNTQSFLNQKAVIFFNDMEGNMEEMKEGLNKDLENKKTNIKGGIEAMEKDLKKEMNGIQKSLKEEIRDMNADLMMLRSLSEARLEQTTVKKNLIRSNTVLVSIVFILLISSIFLTYVNKIKYSEMTAMNSEMTAMNSEMTEMQRTVEHLKSKGGGMKFSNCANQLCIQIDTSKPNYQDGFRIVKEVN